MSRFSRRPGSDEDVWQFVDRDFYRTASLKSASTYREFADYTCARVFDRAFNEEISNQPEVPKPIDHLDPHQRAGVRWVLSRKRSYLAHAPGAGKTAQAITVSCLIPGSGTTVIIVPPGLERNWEREILKFTEAYISFPTIGVVGRSEKRHTVAWLADFIIVPDSMITRPWVYRELKKLRMKLLVVDEASRFKDPSAKRSLAFYGGRTTSQTYAGLFQDAERVVFLDGSPMPNRSMELWAPVYALDPEAIDCMSQRDFGFRYCGARMNDRGEWEFKHSSHEEELRERLRKRFMHVVTEDELDHPERRRSLLFMNQDVRTAEMREWERKALRDLRIDEVTEATSQGEIAHQRKQIGVLKVPWVAKYILSRLENKNEKILVFAWHREVVMGIEKAIGKSVGSDKVASVLGGSLPRDRENTFHGFQEGDLRVIVGNIAAMGRGVNLQKADRVVFAEASWSDELNKQCEKRASRRGRDKELFVRCEYVIAPDSMEERVMTTLFSKQQRVKRVIG